ncbi:MAG: DMT family transporter [Myxococcaceae bacterium]
MSISPSWALFLRDATPAQQVIHSGGTRGEFLNTPPGALLRARLAVLLAAVLWSTAGAAIKIATLSGWQISFGRSLVAALVLFALSKELRTWPSTRVLSVSVAYAGTVVLFVLANKLTTAANAIFIQDTAPLWVMLLSPLLLKERSTRGELLSVPLFFGGLILFFLDELAPGQATGNALALASGVAFASCILGLRWLGEESARALAWGNTLAALISAPFIASGPSLTPNDVGIVVFLGVFQLAVPYLLFTWGLRRVRAVEASLLVLVEPVLNPIWAFLFAAERPGPWAMAGGAVILFATAWRTLAPSGPPSAVAPSQVA